MSVIGPYLEVLLQGDGRGVSWGPFVFCLSGLEDVQIITVIWIAGRKWDLVEELARKDTSKVTHPLFSADTLRPGHSHCGTESLSLFLPILHWYKSAPLHPPNRRGMQISTVIAKPLDMKYLASFSKASTTEGPIPFPVYSRENRGLTS